MFWLSNASTRLSVNCRRRSVNCRRRNKMSTTVTLTIFLFLVKKQIVYVGDTIYRTIELLDRPAETQLRYCKGSPFHLFHFDVTEDPRFNFPTRLFLAIREFLKFFIVSSRSPWIVSINLIKLDLWKAQRLFSFTFFGFLRCFIMLILCFNKPRTAKVGAISKAQNCNRGDPSGFVKLRNSSWLQKFKKNEWGPFGDIKNIPKFFKKFSIKLLKCHSAQKCRREDPLGFSDIHCVANEGGDPLVPPKKFQKKTQCVEKKVGVVVGAKEAPYCFFDVLDVCLFCFFFILDAFFEPYV